MSDPRTGGVPAKHSKRERLQKFRTGIFLGKFLPRPDRHSRALQYRLPPPPSWSNSTCLAPVSYLCAGDLFGNVAGHGLFGKRPWLQLKNLYHPLGAVLKWPRSFLMLNGTETAFWMVFFWAAANTWLYSRCAEGHSFGGISIFWSVIVYNPADYHGHVHSLFKA